jgi:hypothetical protein
MAFLSIPSLNVTLMSFLGKAMVAMINPCKNILTETKVKIRFIDTGFCEIKKRKKHIQRIKLVVRRTAF